MSESVKTFLSSKHELGNTIELDAGFKMAPNPDNEKGFINGMVLLPHQATIVQAMLDVEEKRVVTTKNHTRYNKYTREDVVIESSAMVLSEPFGSGKTFIILGIILHRPLPPAYVEHRNSILLPDVVDWRGRANRDIFKHEITRKFNAGSKMIKPNLIVAGSSVIEQWRKAITDFTKLKVFVIENYYHLDKFIKEYKAKKISSYDIVLLKNGTVVGRYNKESTKENDSMINAIANITYGDCWSRVIYDDWDTIRIPPGSGGISAFSTIIVSATRKTNHSNEKRLVEYPSLSAALKARYPVLTKIVKDETLFTMFNFRNKQEFTEESTNIPKANIYKYVYANPDDNYMRLLGAMGDQDANALMEMLNGDAVKTAADLLGMKTNSVADIFQKMLDKKYEAYLHDCFVLDTIQRAKADITMIDEHPDGKQHSANELEAIRNKLIKKTVAISYRSNALVEMLDGMVVEFTKSKEQNGVAIARVKENVKSGDCQVCLLPLQASDTFIVRCCGIVVCDRCGIAANQISKRYDYATKTTKLLGSCANCKAIVDPRTDLILVDKEFNIEGLLEARGDENEPIVKPPEPEPKKESDEPEIKNPKLKALLAIIRGQIPEKREKTNIRIKHLLQGVKDKPQPDDIKRKVLVFANFNETLELVQDFLKEQSIEYLRLGGTPREMAATVEMFIKKGTVLLINSQHNCAGLNLQMATDLVFFHKIIDENTESQVAGRIARIGQKYNPNIHYLLYNNESLLV